MTTKKDIVSRLRECDQGLLEEYQEPELGDIVTDCSSIPEAANVIEQLREERDQLRNERDEARRRYQIVLDFSHHLLTERAAARQCAKKETDNA